MSTIFSNLFPLSSLNGLLGFTINGVNATDASGDSFASGDINGDGIKDLAIGVPGGKFQGVEIGYVAIIFGKKTPWSSFLEISSLDGISGSLITGFSSGTGLSLAFGDLNGDKIEDLIIGNPNAESMGLSTNYQNAGVCYVLFGHTSPWTSSFNLATLNGNNGFIFQGVSGDFSYGENFCTSVVAADFNNDGIYDLLAGAPSYLIAFSSQGRVGAAVALYGKTSGWNALVDVSSIDGTNGVIFLGDTTVDNFGSAVAAGDLNGDGIKDYIIGSPEDSPNHISSAGITFVVFGQKAPFGSATFQTYNVNGIDGCMFYGINNGDRSGNALTSGKDINGDGIEDLLIGAPYASSSGHISNGNVYAIFGNKSNWTAIINLSGLSVSNGFTIWGEVDGDHCGSSVALGNVNGDKYADILVGASAATVHYTHPVVTASVAGKSYVVYGRETWPATIDLYSFESANLYGCIFEGINSYDDSGTAVSFSDLNGDGIDDVTIGAPGVSPGGLYDVGASYVIFGKNASAIVVGPSSSSTGSITFSSSAGGTSCVSCTPSSTAGINPVSSSTARSVTSSSTGMGGLGSSSGSGTGTDTAGGISSSTGTAGGLDSSTGTGTGNALQSSSTGLTGIALFSSSSTAQNGLTGISSSSGAAIQQSSSAGISGVQQSSSGSITGIQQSSTGGVSGVQQSSSGGVSGPQQSSSGSVTGIQQSSTGSVSGVQQSSSGGVSGAQQSSSGSVTGMQQSSTGSVSGVQQSSSGGVTGIKHSSSGSLSGIQQQSSSGGISGRQQSSSGVDSTGQESGQNSGYGDSSSGQSYTFTSSASKVKPWIFSAIGSAFSMANSYGRDLLSGLNPLSIGSIASHFTFEAPETTPSFSADVPVAPAPAKESGTPYKESETLYSDEPRQQVHPNSNFKMPSLSKTDYLAIAPLVLHHALPLIRKYSPITLPWNKVHPLSVDELEKLNLYYSVLLEKENIRALQKGSHAEKSGLFQETSKFIDRELKTLKNDIQTLLLSSKGSAAQLSDVENRVARVSEKVHEFSKLNKQLKKLDVKIKRNLRKHPESPTIAEISHNPITNTLKHQLVSARSTDSITYLLETDFSANASTPLISPSTPSKPLLFSNPLGRGEKTDLQLPSKNSGKALNSRH